MDELKFLSEMMKVNEYFWLYSVSSGKTEGFFFLSVSVFRQHDEFETMTRNASLRTCAYQKSSKMQHHHLAAHIQAAALLVRRQEEEHELI